MPIHAVQRCLCLKHIIFHITLTRSYYKMTHLGPDGGDRFVEYDVAICIFSLLPSQFSQIIQCSTCTLNVHRRLDSHVIDYSPTYTFLDVPTCGKRFSLTIQCPSAATDYDLCNSLLRGLDFFFSNDGMQRSLIKP